MQNPNINMFIPFQILFLLIWCKKENCLTKRILMKTRHCAVWQRFKLLPFRPPLYFHRRLWGNITAYRSVKCAGGGQTRQILANICHPICHTHPYNFNLVISGHHFVGCSLESNSLHTNVVGGPSRARPPGTVC